MRKEYTRLLIAVNDAKANVKEAVRLYHQRDRPVVLSAVQVAGMLGAKKHSELELVRVL
jgi:hypothetical protein